MMISITERMKITDTLQDNLLSLYEERDIMVYVRKCATK